MMSEGVSAENLSITFSKVAVRGATAVLDLTKGKALILLKAAASVETMATWFNHLELLRMLTAPASRMLSMYRPVTGKSVLSIAMP